MKGESRGRVFKWAPVCLALLHIALACAYAFVTPYCTPGLTNGRVLPDIGAPDECAHATYIEHIFYSGLPILEPGPDRGEFDYEFHQPPLYYEMAFGWCNLIGVTDSGEVTSMYHIVDPAQGLRIRFLNCLIGGLTILGVWFLALWAAGRRGLALGAAAFAALLPMLCAVDGAVSNDPLLICLCTWSLALMAKWADAWSVWRALVLGLLIGAAILTKSTGVLLVPVALCAMLIGGWRRNLVHAIVAVLVAAGLTMPLLFRNYQLYGDILGMRAFYEMYPATVDPSPFSAPRALVHWLYVLGAGTALSFVGEFGYMDIHLPYWIYVPALGMILLALIRSVPGTSPSPTPPSFSDLAAADEKALGRENKGGASLFAVRVAYQVFVWGAVLLYISFNLRYVQPQARYLFPAIGVVALWAVIGAGRTWRYGPAAIISMLALANIVALSTLPEEFHTRVVGARTASAKETSAGIPN